MCFFLPLISSLFFTFSTACSNGNCQVHSFFLSIQEIH
jgi:hypothetical protein